MKKRLLKISVVGGIIATFCYSPSPLAAQAFAYAQNKPKIERVQTEASQIKLRDAILALKNQFNVDILFEEKTVTGISVSQESIKSGKNLEKSLESLLIPNGLTFKKVRKNTYLIMSKKVEMNAPSKAVTSENNQPLSNPQNDTKETTNSATANAEQTVSGKIQDDKGNPLPGASVVLKGTTRGVNTNTKGEFTINVPSSQSVLVISFIGFNSQEVLVGNRTNINIVLTEDLKTLSEVVVVGYGTQTKRDLTGSVDLVTSKDFNKGSIVSADQLLQGKAPGVRITNNGGQPDSEPNIRIRGGASLTANNNPLIVIDGVPIDNSNPAGVKNPLSLINPNDIESFSILKDASATAIYGSRASNGVIIITTKKGSSGKPQYTYSGNVAIGQVPTTVKVMDGNTFSKFIQEYAPNYSYLLGVGGDPTKPTVPGTISNTNWQDQIFRTSITTDQNLSARANLFKTVPSRFSFGFTRAEGLVKTSDLERFTGSVKLTPTLMDKHLKIDINAKGLMSNKNAIDEGGAIGGALSMDPTKPIYSSELGNRFGGYYQNYFLDGNFYRKLGSDNPLAILQQRTRPEKVNKLLGNVEFDYKFHFLPELRAVLNLGLETSKSTISEVYLGNAIQTYQRNQTADLNKDNNFVFNPGQNYREEQSISNRLLDFYLVYNKKFSEVVTNFTAQGGYSYQNFNNDGTKFNYRYNPVTGIRESLNNVRYVNILNLQSFFGRSNVDLYNRYLFTFTVRADASSLFPEGKRWGIFPAVGFAWKLKDESFLKDSKSISDLKLRLGWGVTGQQDITGSAGYYPYRQLFINGQNTSQYTFGNQSLVTYSALANNPNLTWEKTTTLNAGIDFELVRKGFISGSLDIYNRTSTDLLLNAPQAPGQNLTNLFVTNAGELENKGAELNLQVVPISTNNFDWTINGNIAYNIAQIKNLKSVTTVQADESGIPTGTGVKIGYHTVGEQPYSAWVFQQVYDAKGNPVPEVFVDKNNDDVIDNKDRYYKAMRPNWTYGFSTGFTYKNLDFTTSFRGQIGGYVYNGLKVAAGYRERTYLNQGTFLNNTLDFYSGAANPVFERIQGNQAFSDYYLEDASFLRCDNATIGYKFTNAFGTNTNLRVYASANNLFLVTRYKGQDPENFNAIDNNFYPRPRVYTFGLNFDF
ncbi:MAG: TonB-dependent receptor [Arcicella sp.]|nr:TonB-dependent receptor [Arcicella sp.]